MDQKTTTKTPDTEIGKPPVREAAVAEAPAAAAKLIVSSSPHFMAEESIPKIMHTVVMALMPAAAASVYFFGWRALLLIIVCIASCLATEYVFQRIRRKPVKIHDGSAVITGMLLAMTLPAGFPVYGAVLGSVFAIGVGKELFGGLGYNIFNPALLGRAFLMATYPVLTTTWVEPRTVEKAVDAVTAATPIALWKFEGNMDFNLLDMFLGNTAGSLGETSALAIIIGGLYLRYKGYINWKLPLGYLGTIAAFSAIFWLVNPAKYPSPLFHLFAGGAMLGAWFMVTDMVTSPTTSLGQWIFVIVAGVMAVVIRIFGGLPEGVMYSILFMNAFVPLLNKHTRPRVFGTVRAGKG
ncbi:MAG: RnfABCDGE type electron transport complex subunit D [Deltaproteobacteria bacterium]|nr:RnfABCDGE type electron transport complex subunit D [Deltaproteobacteria bacterium]MBZ0218937.1 RnfABCDGE type electron transport complex subunit D [Deltaproteobacteria bacterium]